MILPSVIPILASWWTLLSLWGKPDTFSCCVRYSWDRLFLCSHTASPCKPTNFHDRYLRHRSDEHALKWILSEWFSYQHRKCALTQLPSVNGSDLPPPSYFFDHLQSYLTNCANIITELSEGSQDPSGAFPTFLSRGFYHLWKLGSTPFLQAFKLFFSFLDSSFYSIRLSEFYSQARRVVILSGIMQKRESLRKMSAQRAYDDANEKIRLSTIPISARCPRFCEDETSGSDYWL